MPWEESNKMDERLKFVARLLEGEKMSGICREFGISRKTGYKIFNRYKDDWTAIDGTAGAGQQRHFNALMLRPWPLNDDACINAVVALADH